jgi:hypothetical protein
MHSFPTAIEGSLYWIQPKTFERYYELRVGEQELVASLTFEKTFGTLATATTKEQEWTFKRVGFLNPRVTIRNADSETDLAVFYPKTFGNSSLIFSDGRVVEWTSVNFWQTRWGFIDSQGNSLVQFNPGTENDKFSDLFKTQATVEISSFHQPPGILPLLVLFGWYLIIMHQEETATIASTAACY